MTSTTFRTDALLSSATRWWRCGPWSASPLMRWPDRLLAFVRLIAVVAVLVSIPVGGAVGTVVYAGDAVEVATERAQRTAVDAIVVDRPRYTSTNVRQASASWAGGQGETVGTVRVGRGIEQGDRIRVWTDRSGEPTTAPREPISAVFNGIGVAVMIMVGIGILAWCTCHCTRRLVTWRRNSHWDRQLAQLVG